MFDILYFQVINVHLLIQIMACRVVLYSLSCEMRAVCME